MDPKLYTALMGPQLSFYVGRQLMILEHFKRSKMESLGSACDKNRAKWKE